MPDISSKAVVTDPAALGEGVRVGPFSFLGPEVAVGSGTVIENNVTVTGRTRIGANCRLLPGCVVGCSPAGADDEAVGTCHIAKGNTIREHVIIEAGDQGEETLLGPNCLSMVGCQIGHGAVIEGFDIFANFTRIEHNARVEKYVQTSGFASVAPYASVGAYTYTTGYARIDRDAPPYAIVHGVPFRVRGVNVEKLRRCGFAEDAIAVLKQAFRELFDGTTNTPPPERLERVGKALRGEHVGRLVESLRRSAASATGRCLEPAP